MTKHSGLLRVLGLAILLVIIIPADLARGDGKFYPKVVYKTPPSIPTQRAILKYRDGQEQLIIESALDAEGQSFGWVIPLPSVPTEIKKETPGMLKTLDNVCQPRIFHRPWGLSFGIALAITAFVCTLFAILRRSSFRETMLLFALASILSAAVLLTPSLGSSRTAGFARTPAVKVRESKVIGNYDVSVLQAKTPQALSDWLKENGFAPLPDKDQKVVGDYIREGWCFLTAKLRRNGKGLSTPHPISATFKTDTPVYPMRLTGLTGSPVALDLYVVANEQAKTTPLTREFCDIFSGPKPYAGVRSQHSNTLAITYFEGTLEDSSIGLPSAGELLWDGCVITRLTAELQPEQMSEDYRIAFEKASADRAYYFSHMGAYQYTWLFVVPLGCILMMWTTSFAHKRIARPGGQLFAVTAIVLPISLVTAIAFGCTYALLPKVKIVQTGRNSLIERFMIHERELESRMFELSEENKQFADTDINAIRSAVAGRLAEMVKENDSYKHIIEEASPHNYVLLEDDRGIVFRTFNSRGFPWDVILKPAKQKTSTPSASALKEFKHKKLDYTKQ